MVGFDPSSKSKLDSVEYSIAGAGSGAITRFLCQPLDVLKIRFQLQVEPISKKYAGSKYKSVLQAVKCIAQEEGISALWKGHIPAQCLSVVYGVAQFISFETLTSQCWKYFPTVYSDHRAILHFSCGAASGCFATLVSFPFDVVRTRLVAQGEPKVYRGITHAFSVIYSKHGTLTFFRGLSPTLIQIAPQTGAQFGFYQAFTNLWVNIGAGRDTNRNTQIFLYESLICGSLAGICAKALVYPLDLAKKRLQIQGFETARSSFGKRCHIDSTSSTTQHPHLKCRAPGRCEYVKHIWHPAQVFQCNGLLHCIATIVKTEGSASLLKGLWPSLLKAAATTAIHFAAYEQICAFLLSFHH
ncbi:mitochondrial thiamine pyrophosphate carrier-like isoform X1 [Schistocerca americana]|uniref:mitochondrial thiamine pyrophosphate carrier-like isoform X1 n=1 Tax=Schistocerca americana TaxID=7009 RepID=UPI001F4FAA07|nr:mitochondrial thiamine pyrophosphate carrier-like isoform X1 [Schistocerca americana]XP_046992791.1 mitochondrial thiamine pyrophosphate carrier-like isoform X1 [Schistocerca americana]XP_046992792.1 mitochondrial thiamine pyrophosphate carrier-like isoform X1 [Schistocerca americana]